MKRISILRRWNNPTIEINVTEDAIHIHMSLNDFVAALTDEAAEPLVRQVVQGAGNPALLFTNAQLERRLIDAIEGQGAHAVFVEAAGRVIEAVKAETVYLT